MNRKQLIIEKVTAYVAEMQLGFSYASGKQDMARGIIWEIATSSGVGFGESAFFNYVPQPDGGEDTGGPRALLMPNRKRVLVTTHVGWVHFLDAGSGEVLWANDLNAPEAQPNLREMIAKWVERDDALTAE